MGRRKKLEFSEVAPAVEVKPSTREAIGMWMQERLSEIEEENKARIELLRTVGEHPSPVFQNIVQINGALGMPKGLVAKMLNMSETTLNKFYSDDYDLGKLSAMRSVAMNMMRIGSSETDPNAGRVGMQILDRRGGEEWKPPAQKMEIDDSRNKPPIIDSSKLTAEERQQLRDMLTRVASGGEGDPIQSSEDEGEII